LSCDTTQNNFNPTTSYILGPGNEQLAELAWTGGVPAPAHTNVWAGGQLASTYSNADPINYPAGILYFHLTDWLGTRRVLTDQSGNLAQTCDSLPFGDGESCPTTPTEHLFTGKERDAESGNDYFGARYYASSMGRFMSPDWSAKIEPVPYSKLDNPQSLNLYAYVGNNPLGGVDADGHAIHLCTGAEQGAGVCVMGDVSTEQGDQQAAQQQNGSSSGHSFWSHVSNLLHLHSWNYGMRESVTMRLLPASESEPNSNVDLATSAAGLLSATPGAVPGAPGLMLGLAAGGVSSVNDPSGLNLTINATGGALGFASYAAEGTAVGTGATVAGFGLAAGATAWSVSNWISTNVITPVFTPDANQSNTINANGVTIQAPDAFDWSQP
jgi:RHS repeat-associated protein